MSTNLLEKIKAQPTAPTPRNAPLPPANPVPVPTAAKPPRRPDDDDEDEDEEPGFFRRHRVLLILAFLAGGGAWYAFSGPSAPSAPTPVRKAAVPINVTLPPPPLPPPPPPKVEPPKVEQPKEEQMEEQAPVEDETPPEPTPDNSPPPIGTNNVGNGPADGFGLGKATAGSGNGTGRRVGGGGGSKFGYYAAQVQNSIASAIKRNSLTKSATMTVVARIWADETGRITRATLSGTSGDPALDAALKNDVLTGLQLQSPPPPDMKMPINLRLTARAPR